MNQKELIEKYNQMLVNIVALRKEVRELKAENEAMKKDREELKKVLQSISDNGRIPTILKLNTNLKSHIA